MFSIPYGNVSNPVPVLLNVNVPILNVESIFPLDLSLAICLALEPLYVVKLLAMYGLLFLSKLIAPTELDPHPLGPVPTTNELSRDPFEFILTNRLAVDPEYVVNTPATNNESLLKSFKEYIPPF